MKNHITDQAPLHTDKTDSDLLWSRLFEEVLLPIEEEIDLLNIDITTVNQQIENYNRQPLNRNRQPTDLINKIIILGKRLEDLTQVKNHIEMLLEQLQSGSLEFLNEIMQFLNIGDDCEPEGCVSKRKQAVQRDLAKLAKLGISVETLEGELGVSDRRRLATGQHKKRVTGNIDPYDAFEVFHRETVDTHGGKVRAGVGGGKVIVGDSGQVRRVGGKAQVHDILARQASREFPGKKF